MKNKACSEYNTTESFTQSPGSPGSSAPPEQPVDPCSQPENPHNLESGTETNSNIVYYVGIVCFIILFIIFKHAGYEGVTLSLRNTFKNILNTASIDLIILCLTVTLSVTYIIRGKIEGYYQGIYEYNVEDSLIDNNSVINVLGETEPVPTPYGMPGDKVNLSEINTILHKINMLGICTILMLIISVIFKHYPIKQTNFPGSWGPVAKVRTVMGLLAATFLGLMFYVFANCFANLDELNKIAQKTDKVRVECGGHQYYLPTVKEHLYPSLGMVYNLWVVAIVAIVIATGSAFGTLFVNVSKKAHAMITIQSNLISELSQEGRLIAYELNDPLFKLIDSAIAKKVKQKQAAPYIIKYKKDDETYVPKVRTPIAKSAVLPRYSTDVPLKLFDFVKFKEYKAIRDDKGDLVGADDSPSKDKLYLIISVDDWTIINTPENIPGRIYYNVKHNMQAGPWTESIQMKKDERVLDGNIERRKTPGKLEITQGKVFAYSEEEILKMDPEQQASLRLQPHLDSREAKKAIFGNHDYMNTPDFIHQQEFNRTTNKENMGSIKEYATVTIIPIDKRQINLTKLKKANSNFEELLADISSALRNREPTVEVDDVDRHGARLINDNTYKTLFNLIQQLLIEYFINGASFKTVRTTPKALTLAYRIKENINLFDLTALDLIHIRYSLIENVVFKYFTDNKDLRQNELQMIYKDRRDKFPTSENLIREILPSLKKYVDDKDRADFENSTTYRGMPAHRTTDEELTDFAFRFNKLLNIEETTYTHDTHDTHDTDITGVTKKARDETRNTEVTKEARDPSIKHYVQPFDELVPSSAGEFGATGGGGMSTTEESLDHRG